MTNKVIDQWNHVFPVHTATEGANVIRRAAIGLYLIAIGNILLAKFSNDITPAIDAWVWISFGITLQHCQSRTVALLIIPYGLFSVASNIYCQFYLHIDSRSIIFGVIAIMIGIHAVIATQEYHNIRRSHVIVKNAIKKTIQALVYLVIFSILSSFGIVIPYYDTLVGMGGPQLALFFSLMLPTLGMFMAFNGWLPFTFHEPVCRFDA